MKLWPVAPYFYSLFESGKIQNIAVCHFFTVVQEMTCCNVLYVPRFQKWVKKKGATGQSFIRKEITSYRIGTLVLNSTTQIAILYLPRLYPSKRCYFVHCGDRQLRQVCSKYVVAGRAHQATRHNAMFKRSRLTLFLLAIPSLDSS